MARQFLANLSFLVVLNLIIKPVYILGIEVSVQNTVGTSSYGLYFALLNSAYLLQILNDFGLQIYNNRRVALDSAFIAGSFKSILRLKGILSLIYVGLLLALTFALGYGDEISLILPIAANLILASMVLWLRSNISGLGFYRADSTLSVMDKSLMILICGYLLIFQHEDFTIYHFVYSQMASLGITAVVAVVILIKKGAFITGLSPAQDLPTLIKQAWPFALAVFLMTMYTRIDAVMVEQIAEDGDYESGLYAAGYRLFDAANMIAFLFGVLLLPMFTKLLNKRDEVVALLSVATRLMWVLTLTVVVLCVSYSDELLRFLYRDAVESWSSTFAYLIVSYIAVGLMYVHGIYLTAVGNMFRLNVLYASCVVVNIALNLVLIPGMGAEGAAIATLITQGSAATIIIAMSSSEVKLRISWSQVAGALAFAIAAVLIVSALSYVTNIYWVLEVIIALPLILTSALITRVVLQSDLKALFAR